MEFVCVNLSALVTRPQPTQKRASIRHRGLRIVVKDLHYTVNSNSKKGAEVTLLKGVSAWFEQGEMAAVMGVSGSGKTTLLDLISGRTTSGRTSGLVLFGNTSPDRHWVRRHTGYVEQFDMLVDSLSVYEMLLYTAELKRPMSEPLADKRKAIEVLLEKLALTGCKDVRIGSALKRGISGGEAKRTNIGIALITSPAVLFLDEPTSGLDFTTANEVMAVVKDLAVTDGTTICATVHSPSSHTYRLFDSCLLLAEGSTAFFGGPQAPAIEFFTASCGARQPEVGDNLAEWMMDIVTQADRNGTAKDICAAYQQSGVACANNLQLQHLVATATVPKEPASISGSIRSIITPPSTPQPPRTPPRAAGGDGSAASLVEDVSWHAKLCGRHAYETSWFWSLRVLLKYRTLRNYRDVPYLGSRLADKIVFSIMIMMVYVGLGDEITPEALPAISSLMLICMLWPAYASIGFLPAIILDRGLYVREHNDGLYRPAVYLLFKMVDELALNWVVGLVTCAIIFFGIQLQGSYLFFWLTIMATLSNGIVIAYGVSALSPTMDVANTAVPALLSLLLFLSGSCVRVAQIPVYLRWVARINVLRYAFGGLMINQFAGQKGKAYFGKTEVLDYYSLTQFKKGDTIAFLAASFCFWWVLTWLALAHVRHHRR